jgi:hypothetical protein
VKICKCSSVWSPLVAISWLSHFGLMTLFALSQYWIVFWLLIWFQMASLVHAAQTETSFPDITFSAFNQIIQSTFGSNISLATVLTLLFTITENVDLLNLHFRQQHPQFQGENKTRTTGWLIALSRALIDRLGSTASSLYDDDEKEDDLNSDDKVKLIAGKELGSKCLVRDCTNDRFRDTSACRAHRAEWQKFTKYQTRQTRSGIRRMLQRPGEAQPWNPQRRGPNLQHHVVL